MQSKTRFFIIDLTSGDRGQDRDLVARSEWRVDPIAVAHVISVYEQVDVASHGAGLVANATVQCGMPPLEFLERGPDSRRRNSEFRTARTVPPQRRGNVDFDGHGCVHADINLLDVS